MNSTAELNMLLVLLFVALPLYVLFYQFGLRYVITYRLTNRSVLIMLFWVVPIFCISYRRIKEMKVGADWPGVAARHRCLEFLQQALWPAGMRPHLQEAGIDCRDQS